MSSLSCPGDSSSTDIWATNADNVVCWVPFSQEAASPLGECCNNDVLVTDSWPTFYDIPGAGSECLIWCTVNPGDVTNRTTDQGADPVHQGAMDCLSQYRNQTWGARARCNAVREKDRTGGGDDGDVPGQGEDAASLVRAGSVAGLVAGIVSLLLASGIAF